MKTLLALAALALLPLGNPAADAPIRVLIIDGFNNHYWKLTTALIRGIIEPTGLFTVTVSTSPPAAGALFSFSRPLTTPVHWRPARAWRIPRAVEGRERRWNRHCWHGSPTSRRSGPRSSGS